jgi:hypothetical protein
MPVHSSNDRSSLCSFSFADGRRCRTPRSPGHPHLCTFHARKEAQALAAHQVGRDISTCFSGEYLSACDLSSALGHLFSAVVQGHIKPKTATVLAISARRWFNPSTSPSMSSSTPSAPTRGAASCAPPSLRLHPPPQPHPLPQLRRPPPSSTPSPIQPNSPPAESPPEPSRYSVDESPSLLDTLSDTSLHDVLQKLLDCLGCFCRMLVHVPMRRRRPGR